MPTKRFRRVIILWFVLLNLTTLPVQAHANLTRSEPPAGAILAESPTVILLEFTESLDPAATSVYLVDAHGDELLPGPGEIDANDARLLRLTLPPLAEGTYSAIWQARSAVDGHITRGNVGFSVGTTSPVASFLPPPGIPDPATARPHPADTFARWWLYLSAAATIGPILFALLVWHPVQRQTAPLDAGQIDVWLSRLAQWGCVAGVAGTLLFTVVQAGLIGAGGMMAIISGRNGALLLLRLGVWLGLLFVLYTPTHPRKTLPPRSFPFAAALGVMLIIPFSLQSHNAALPGFQAIPATFSSWLHLMAMCAWLGGLYPLFHLLRANWLEETTRDRLVPAFTRLALISVTNLILTGLFTAILHVKNLPLLVETTYGQALTVKTVIFICLLGLGAINWRILSPQLHGDGTKARHGLGKTIRIELLLGTLLLLVVGIMMGSAPAWEAWQAQQRLGFMETVRQEKVRLTLRIAPLQIGENEIAVDVVDRREGAAAVPATIVLRLTPPDSSFGETQIETVEQGGGRYSIRGSHLTQSGTWQVEIILRRRGFDDIRHTFNVTLVDEHLEHGG